MNYEYQAIPQGSCVRIKQSEHTETEDPFSMAYIGKTGHLEKINTHNSDGDFYGISIDDPPSWCPDELIYFWRDEFEVILGVGTHVRFKKPWNDQDPLKLDGKTGVIVGVHPTLEPGVNLYEIKTDEHDEYPMFGLFNASELEVIADV